MMKIGVICEGPTDYHAIKQFVGAALSAEGISATFVDIQPQMDGTQPRGGWGKVENWLSLYPPAVRVSRYFGGGLFDDDLDEKACDVFLIQMDADIIDDGSFKKHMLNDYGVEVDSPACSVDRGNIIREILTLWGGLDKCGQADRERHVLAPAVESTETWCVGAFARSERDLESLRGEDLMSAFMGALLKSEGRDVVVCAEVDKNIDRRSVFCEKHAVGHGRLRNQCPHFDSVVMRLKALGEVFWRRHVAEAVGVFE